MSRARLGPVPGSVAKVSKRAMSTGSVIGPERSTSSTWCWLLAQHRHDASPDDLVSVDETDPNHGDRLWGYGAAGGSLGWWPTRPGALVQDGSAARGWAFRWDVTVREDHVTPHDAAGDVG